MFKRRRATSTPAPNRPPSASASLAASKAFLQDRESNASLSSAAAAAALRTHPSGPTAVGDTVTKRMVRKASISSQGSGSQQRPALGRSPSSGSMTERSFRSPSPSRNSPVIGPLDDAPPVPAVPKDISGVAAVHRRAASLEPPQRAASTGGRGRGRGQSVDSTRTQPGARQHVMSLAQVPEDDYSGRPRSVNFSRPMSPSASSITSQTTPTLGGHSGWFAAPVTNSSIHFRTGPPTRPQTAVGVRRYDAQNTWQVIQNAADKPVSTRRNQIPQGVEGARLATGSMGIRPSGSGVSLTPSHPRSGPVDPKSADAVYDPSTRTFIRKQEAMARFRELHEEEEPPPARLTPYAPVSRDPSPAVYHKTQPSPIPFRDVRELDLSPPQHVPRVSTPASSNVDLQHSTRSFQAPARNPSPVPLEEVRGQYPTPPAESNGAALPQVEPVPSEPKPLVEDRPDSERPHPAETGETGAILARQTSEDLAGPDIRPSPDANISRKLDTTLSEPVKVAMESPLSPKLASNQDSPYPRVGTPDAKIGRGRGSIRTDRGSSLSPPRSAHFAVGSLELPNGIRHQPPPRSVSPVKSALKSSPSVSRRNSSPLANNGRVLSKDPLSETSDAVSEEGVGKKKKSVRVSFEETPIVAGVSAYEDAPSSPSGLSQSRWSAVNNHDEDLDDFMKPRPALPSFGSIREKNRRHIERDEPEKVTETVSSSMTTSVGSIYDPIESSSDHALGHIVADDFASKKQSTSRDPLPPEVTSVEGSGYYSDSGSSDTALDGVPPEHADGTGKESSIAEPKSLANSVESIPPRGEVPVIAIQPATPNLIETAEPPTLPPAPAVTNTSHTESNIRHTAIPGGWDDEDDQAREATQERKQLAEAAPSTRISFVEPPSPSRKQEPESSDDDDDSIYSDAYEEFAETEEGAFASIDEIVESPIVTPRTGLMQSRYAPTETSPRTEPAAIVEGSVNTTTTATGGRGKTEGRSQIGQAVTAPPAPLPSSALNTTPKQNGVAPQATAVGASPKATVSSRTSQPTLKPAQEPVPVRSRKSSLKTPTGGMQMAPAGDSQMRRTMRGSSGRAQPTSPEPSMRTSMRSSGSMAAGSALGLAASRHSMSAVDSTAPRGALQKKNIAAAAVQSKHRPQNVEVPVQHMPLAYDSDSGASESSFQRERKQRRASRGIDAGGRYTMRRSMRTEPAPTMRPTPAIRPMSPATTSSPLPPAFRKSLRPTSPVQEAGPAKSSRFSIRSLSPAGRFRNTLSKGSKAMAPALSASKPAVSSRFEDSSDEEFQSRSKRFQSRFADSDDEEDFVLPPGLAPVRGIPKRPGEEDGDSTDLEDEESEDEAPPPPKPLDKSPGALSNGQSTGLQKSKHATLLPAFESPKKSKTKRGLFGLGKKKDLTPPSPESTTRTANGLPKPAGASDIPMPPAHRDRDRDTSRTLTPIGEEENVFETPPSGTHRAPKLQRRITPQNTRSTSDSWPLPASPATTAVDERPRTSDGAGSEKHTPFKRPTLSKRWSSTTGTGTVASMATTATSGVVVDPKTGKEVIVGRSGKKKKFQGLRRVFGLND